MEHGILGGVAGGHIVPGIVPASLVRAVGGLLAGILQIVALRHHIAVVAVVVGHSGNAQRFAAGHQMLGQQVILKVRLVGGITGLALEAGDTAVELGKADGVPGGNEVGHVLGLGLGLEGVIAVEVETAGRSTGEVSTAFHVLLRYDDEKHIVQELVKIHIDGLRGVVLIHIHGDGGRSGASVGILALEIAQVSGGIGHQVGHGHGTGHALGAHLGGQLSFALGGKAGEVLIADGLAFGSGGLHQHPGKGEHAVGGGHFVGVDVGVHHGHLIVGQIAIFNIRNEGSGIALGLILDGHPLIHSGSVFGHDQIGHLQALQAVVALAHAHGELLHIEIGVLSGKRLDGVDLSIELSHGVEAVVGSHLQRSLAQGLAVHGGGEVKVTAHVHVVAAVGVGDGEVVQEVAVVFKGKGQIDLSVHRLGGRDHVLKEGGLAVLAHPGVQGAALGLVGEELVIQVILGLVGDQGPHSGGGLFLGDFLGHVYGDHGLEGPLVGQGDHVLAAVIAGVFKHTGNGSGGFRRGGRDHTQGQQEGERQQQRERPPGGGLFLHLHHQSLS